MKAIILGSGGASGVPAVASGWGECDPTDPHNRRRRPSILVEDGDCQILVDTSPDLRAQLLDANVRRLDAVLFTHDHADHLNGIDDLREINRAMKGPLAIWAHQDVLDTIGRRFAYVLEPLAANATSIYKPILLPHTITGPFTVGPLTIQALDQDHGYGRTLGFRFGALAYSTDVVDLPEDSLRQLEGIDTWIVGCLGAQPHPTHAHVDKVLGWAERIKPRRTVITHMGPRLDYATLKARLPAHVEPAYDGMIIEVG
jgi:phosphoribosyl 1,2-cyclic phosphate phosphodiesterase